MHKKQCFTLLEVLTCLLLICIGAFPLIQHSYKLTQESIRALHDIEMQQTADEQLLYWKEYVYENQLVPKSLEKSISIGNSPYHITFNTYKKEVNILEITEEKNLLYQLEVEIKKENKCIFSRKYPILIEVL